METKTLLLQSKNILILTPKEAASQDVHQSLILLAGLKKLGKNPAVQQQPEQEGLPALQEEKTFVVSLKGLAPWISKIQYEKTEKDLKLYFTLQKGEVSPDALSLQIQNHADLTIIVGEHPAKDKSSTGASISGEEAQKALAEILASQEDPSTKLFGLALSKLHFVERLDLYLAEFSPEDFRASQTTEQALIPVLREIQQTFTEQTSYLFLYQPSLAQEPKGLGWIVNPELKDHLSRSGQVQEKEKWVLLSLTSASMSQLRHALLP